MKNNLLKNAIWLLIAILGASAVGGIALNRGESINALWFITAALCVYAIAYRFYAAWIAATVLAVDQTRATPAERLDNGRDFVPTNKWIVFGHHFAAIAGPGPLVGPTLAAQFGYLPGTLWLLFGSVLGGCVQDMVILFLSTRRNAKSLGQMARDELGPLGGTAALIGTFSIMLRRDALSGRQEMQQTQRAFGLNNDLAFGGNAQGLEKPGQKRVQQNESGVFDINAFSRFRVLVWPGIFGNPAVRAAGIAVYRVFRSGKTLIWRLIFGLAYNARPTALQQGLQTIALLRRNRQPAPGGADDSGFRVRPGACHQGKCRLPQLSGKSFDGLGRQFDRVQLAHNIRHDCFEAGGKPLQQNCQKRFGKLPDQTLPGAGRGQRGKDSAGMTA